MAGKRERWVRFVSVNLGVSPESTLVDKVSLMKLIEPIKNALLGRTPLQRKPRNSARRHARLVDLTVTQDKKHAIFLFRLIDKDAIDATYEDFEDGDIEPHPKKPTQGNRVTAHLVVRLKSGLKSGKKRYPALLEETQGLGASRIEPILDSLAGRFGRGSYKDAAGKEATYRCRLEVKPKVVGSIREELSRGVLKGFTLVHSIPPKTGNDETLHIEERKKRLEVAVVGAGIGDKLDEIWKTVRSKANKEDYELVRATYENADGRISSVDMQTRRADALEDLVTRTKKITLDCDVNYDQSGVSESIVARMVEVLEGS